MTDNSLLIQIQYHVEVLHTFNLDFSNIKQKIKKQIQYSLGFKPNSTEKHSKHSQLCLSGASNTSKDNRNHDFGLWLAIAYLFKSNSMWKSYTLSTSISRI